MNRQLRLPAGKKASTLVFIVCASLVCGVCAQVPTTIPIVPEPVGSGARALGQSAFIAVADDATAASWNPAGLIYLEKPEASLVGAWKASTSDLSSLDNSRLYEEGRWSRGEINFMSYAHPMEVGNTDVVISINYHQVYDLELELDWVEPGKERVEAGSKGAIAAYSLAGGLSVPSYPKITIGASFNWYGQSLLNDYTRQAKKRVWSLVDSDWLAITETLDDFRGYNFTFGLLWDIYERQENLLTLGFVCHTPFTAKVDRRVVEARPLVPQGVPVPVDPLEMDFPLSLGAGANYRLSDRLSAALDLEWKDWSKWKYTGSTASAPSDTFAVRLGFECLDFPDDATESVLAYRGGILYEPRPTWDDTLPVYGLSLGLGWTLKERWSLDFAYQFRWGQGELTVRSADVDYSIEEHFIVTSLVTYF